jgi:streptogramin lyase
MDVLGDLLAGPDGALWFMNVEGDSLWIGRVTSGGRITAYTDPIFAGVRGLSDLTIGPDRALWFVDRDYEKGAASIGRITTGGEITSYTHPGLREPIELTVRPDRALWFSNPDFHAGLASIGRITTGGAISIFPTTRAVVTTMT